MYISWVTYTPQANSLPHCKSNFWVQSNVTCVSWVCIPEFKNQCYIQNKIILNLYDSLPSLIFSKKVWHSSNLTASFLTGNMEINTVFLQLLSSQILISIQRSLLWKNKHLKAKARENLIRALNRTLSMTLHITNTSVTWSRALFSKYQKLIKCDVYLTQFYIAS